MANTISLLGNSLIRKNITMRRHGGKQHKIPERDINMRMTNNK
jgi:hypothetical protein